jgi:hypothetical protein
MWIDSETKTQMQTSSILSTGHRTEHSTETETETQTGTVTSTELRLLRLKMHSVKAIELHSSLKMKNFS